MRFHLCPTLALAGRKDRSNSSHRPTLPTISSTSTTLVPRWRRLLAANSLLMSSKESNLFDACSLLIRATTARRRARRLARVKSASTCSFRFMYGIIFQPSQKWVYEIWLGNKRNERTRPIFGLWRGHRPWLKPELAPASTRSNTTPKTTLTAPRRLAPRKYPSTPSSIAADAAVMSVLSTASAATVPPTPARIPRTLAILPTSSFSVPAVSWSRPGSWLSSRSSAGRSRSLMIPPYFSPKATLDHRCLAPVG